MNSFATSVLAALALRPIMGAEETSIVRLDRQAEQEAFEGRSTSSIVFGNLAEATHWRRRLG
jgi:hypothetical protein